MAYYSQYFLQQEKKIPTPISIIIILFILLVVFRVFNYTSTPLKAVKKSLKQLKIVNLSNNEATLIWETEEATVSWIVYGENKNPNITALDERDLSEKKTKRKYHISNLKNLKSQTTYYFKILTEEYLIEDAKGSAFSFKTSANPLPASVSQPIYGKIINIDNTPLSNAIVMLSVDSKATFGVITTENGEWLIVPRFSNSIAKEKLIKIEILNETGQTTTINALFQNLSPLPQTVIIGQDYNFLEEENNVLSAQIKAGDKSKNIDIIFPRERMIIPGNNPLIKGIGLPNKEVVVFVESPTTYSFRVKVSKNGEWKVLVPEALTPGEHKVTAITQDAQGKEIKIVRNFQIIKSGEQVLGDATGSATPTLIAPTIKAEATSAPVYPSSIPTAAPPISGNNIRILSVVSGSLIIIGLGIMFAF